jgi:hypothetical protein
MMYDNIFWGMGWMRLTGAVIAALVAVALIKYVFFR